MSSMQAFMSRTMADSFLLTWNILSVASFIVPFFIFVIGRATSDRWMQNWENRQNQNNNDGQNGNNYGGEYNNQYGEYSSWNNPECYDEYGYYHGPTHWWQFWKKCNYGEGEDRNEERAAPWWYIWGGDERRDDPENEGRNAAVTFMYLWSLLLLGGLAYMGNCTDMKLHKLESLRWMLVGMANFLFALIVMVIGLEGVVVDPREMERDGFYGQSAVLLLITSIFALVQSIVFLSWTTKRINVLKALEQERLINGEKPPSNGPGADGEYVSVEYDKQITKSTGNNASPPGYIAN